MIWLDIKFHMPSFNILYIIIVKHKEKENVCFTAILLFYIVWKNCTEKSYNYSQGLLMYIISGS
jgi:hypothetical protein